MWMSTASYQVSGQDFTGQQKKKSVVYFESYKYYMISSI